MRIKLNKNKQQYKHDDTRIIKKFAWIPITIGNDFRWLEIVIIKQHCYMEYDCNEYGVFQSGLKWRNIGFIPSDPLYDCPNRKTCSHVDNMICTVDCMNVVIEFEKQKNYELQKLYNIKELRK